MEEATQMLGFDSRIGVSQAKRHSQPGVAGREAGRWGAPCSLGLQSTQDAPVRAEEKQQGATRSGVLGPHLQVKNPLKSLWFRHHCADRGNRALESPALIAPGRCQRALAGPSAVEREPTLIAGPPALEQEPTPQGPLWLDKCPGYSLQV